MRKSAFVKRFVVTLALLGVVAPQAQISASEQQNKSVRQVKVLPAHSVLDVSLDSTGAFRGRVVDHAGNPVEGAVVAVKQGKNKVSDTVTDGRGEFAINDLKSGTYNVSSGATEGVYRVWTEKAAPPGSMNQALLTQGANGARGQYGGFMGDGGGSFMVAATVASLGLGTAGTIVAIDANRRARHASNDAKKSP